MAYCKKCGAENPTGYSFCSNCGSPLETEQEVRSEPENNNAQQQSYYAPAGQSYTAPVQQPAPNYTYNFAAPVNNDVEPTGKYKPLGAWAYFGWSLLFSIPIVGFILLIVMSFSESNINRRNFARSFWCALLIIGIILGVVLIISVAGGTSISHIIRQYSR